MKILVTGGTGFIGSHIVDTYIENRYEAVVIDNLSTRQLSNLNLAATFSSMDIRSPHLNEIFRISKQFSGFSKTANYGPAKPGETQKIYLDTKKAKPDVGWMPTVDIQGGLENTVNYIKMNGIMNATTKLDDNAYNQIAS
jgi:nucleoside-diphosphate-sugar epimerase